MTRADEKRELRRRTIALRDALDAPTRKANSAAICRRVLESPEFRRARVVLLFASFGSEVDTGDLLEASLRMGKRLALPRVDPETRRLELREVRSPNADLTPGTWGIPEPIPERCPEVALHDIDFVLVPGVAFDRELRRLGYGGGYYDRVLAAVAGRAPAIAICFAAQVVAEVPADEHDMRVRVLITETERIDRP
ncbi:MAG: 5-formyltetrahydrofolate cyclo-ligase [Armatimonadetes bacterium]|nr:5-formyltetrahydrofolate cyclo-ligase [Armatimonadota bacterium]